MRESARRASCRFWLALGHRGGHRQLDRSGTGLDRRDHVDLGSERIGDTDVRHATSLLSCSRSPARKTACAVGAAVLWTQGGARPRRGQLLEGLAAAEEAPERGHELFGALLPERLRLGAEDAVPRVAVEKPEGDLLERGLDCADLGHDLDAVAVLFDHSLHAADLAFDAAKAGDELILGRTVRTG